MGRIRPWSCSTFPLIFYAVSGANERLLSDKAVKLQQRSYLTSLFSPYRASLGHLCVTCCQVSTQSSSTNIAARRFSCCARLEQSSYICIRTADSFTSFSSELKTYVRKTL